MWRRGVRRLRFPIEGALEDLAAVPSGYSDKIGAAENFLVEMPAGGQKWEQDVEPETGE